MTLVIVSILAGAVLGLRFTVLVVVPAAILTFAAACMTAWIQASSHPHTILLVVAAETALQIGYLVGVMVRFTMAAARAPHTAESPSHPVLPSSA